MNLSQFITDSEVVRNNENAEIIIDYYEGHPIRLIGFKEETSKTDFEILESGFNYYNILLKNLE